MELNQVSALLESAPMKLETGFERLESGVLHVACRTDMHGCSGEMFEWWFRSRPDTQRYIWWHPVDHVASHWIEGTADTHIGSIHLAEESLTIFRFDSSPSISSILNDVIIPKISKSPDSIFTIDPIWPIVYLRLL